MRTISYDTYLDKVLGGWMGKYAGGILSASPLDFKNFNGIQISDELYQKKVSNIGLDFQILWLDLVKHKGPHVREQDFGDYWKTHIRLPQNEFGIACRNLNLGIYPPQSGEHNNDHWRTGSGSLVRSDLWGMLNPGMPAQAAYYASLDSFVDHYDFSVDAERFLSALAAEAFFEDNIFTIIETVSEIFEHQCPFTDLLDYALELRDECTYDMAIQKMSSRYGDAEAGNGPMTMGFLLLILMYHEANLDNLVHALHLEKCDSLAATVGGLYGILIGASNFEQKWRDHLGDHVQMGPDIVGIDHAATLSELADETCRAGLNFIDFFKHIQIFGKGLKPFVLSPRPFSLNTIFVNYEPGLLLEEQQLDIEFENLTLAKQAVEIYISSDDLEFSQPEFDFEIEGLEFKAMKTTFTLLPEALDEVISANPQNNKAVFSYEIDVWINGEQQQPLTRGIPYYGTWLMFGPFMSGKPGTAPVTPQHSDDDEASALFPQFNNFDKIKMDSEFLTVTAVRDILQQENFSDYPFQIEPFNPEAFKINLHDYFFGRGEKTIYLYSKVFSKKVKKAWMVIGCSAYIRVWCNGAKVFERRDIRGAWPHDSIETELNKGENDILIRIDMPIDHVDFEFGFKEYLGKPPHQSFWDVELVPFVLTM